MACQVRRRTGHVASPTVESEHVYNSTEQDEAPESKDVVDEGLCCQLVCIILLLGACGSPSATATAVSNIAATQGRANELATVTIQAAALATFSAKPTTTNTPLPTSTIAATAIPLNTTATAAIGQIATYSTAASDAFTQITYAAYDVITTCRKGNPTTCTSALLKNKSTFRDQQLRILSMTVPKACDDVHASLVAYSRTIELMFSNLETALNQATTANAELSIYQAMNRTLPPMTDALAVVISKSNSGECKVRGPN